ncbi:MAG: KEOPS complex subunit Pcc1 [Halobacteriales archaeon]
MTPEFELEMDHPEAERLARCLRPDDTDEIDTRATDGVLRVDIERDSASSLRTTADDVLRNLDVAVRVLEAEPADTA